MLIKDKSDKRHFIPIHMRPVLVTVCLLKVVAGTSSGLGGRGVNKTSNRLLGGNWAMALKDDKRN